MASHRGQGKEPLPSPSGSSSSASSASGHKDVDKGVELGVDEWDGRKNDTYDQRRVRHLSTILVRNLLLPDVQQRGSIISTFRRPVPPRRSLSVTSNGSVGTLRRTPSNRTIRPSTRRRASSIVSSKVPHGDAEDDDEDESSWRHDQTQASEYQRPSFIATWDAKSLHDALDTRLAYVFVSFSRPSDGKEYYRTTVSQSPGLHHGWGQTPNAAGDPDGVDLGAISEGDGHDDEVMISLWAASQRSRDKLRRTDDETNVTDGKIVPGEEHKNGMQLIWQQEVRLSELQKLTGSLADTSLTLPPNTIVLGLSSANASLSLTSSEDDDGNQAKSKRTSDSRRTPLQKANQTHYFIVNPALSARRAEGAKSQNVYPTYSHADKNSLRKYLKEGKISRAYDVADILRLIQLQQQQAEVGGALQDIRTRIEGQFDDKAGPIAHERVWGEEEERLKVLRAKYDGVIDTAKARRNALHERKEALQRRRARLEIARRMMASERKAYEELQKKMNQLAKVRSQIEGQIYARRVVLLRQLERIYPIELVDGAQLLFSILDIPLANQDGKDEEKRTTKNEQDDDTVSSALGLVAQMVALMSTYTDTPLHYPIATAGSRSVIQDAISVMSGPRAFPLYAKGVERYRFDYGHFLLNKDIEQLMNYAGITILDIRNTLPNMKNLIVTLTASSQPSSKLSRRNHIGEQMISLHAGAPAEGKKGAGDDVPASAASDQIGYGTVVNSVFTNADSTASKRPASRWGMSLLGWGSPGDSAILDKHQNSTTQPSRREEAASQIDVPTTRKLGK